MSRSATEKKARAANVEMIRVTLHRDRRLQHERARSCTVHFAGIVMSMVKRKRFFILQALYTRQPMQKVQLMDPILYVPKTLNCVKEMQVMEQLVITMKV